MALIIRSSAIHAAGCYTTTAVRKGTRVAEYTGPRLSKEEADAANEESPITYLFGLGDGSIVIDGHCMAMFINHSCDPNCETEETGGRVWIMAIRKIPPAKRLPTTTASTTAARTRQFATAAPKVAAAPCTRPKRSGAGRLSHGNPPERSSPVAATAPPRYPFRGVPRSTTRKTQLRFNSRCFASWRISKAFIGRVSPAFERHRPQVGYSVFIDCRSEHYRARRSLR